MSPSSVLRDAMPAEATLAERVRARLRADGIVPTRDPEAGERLARAEVRRHNDTALARGAATLDDEDASVRGVLAEWEREVIGERTSAAMQAAKRQGRHMGRVSRLSTTTADRLMALRTTHTLAATAAQLNAEGLLTATGGAWSVGTVAKVQQRLTRTAAGARVAG